METKVRLYVSERGESKYLPNPPYEYDNYTLRDSRQETVVFRLVEEPQAPPTADEATESEVSSDPVKPEELA